MLRMRQILREHAEADSVNRLLAVWGFIDDTLVTKAGHLGLVYRMTGVDYECLDHAQRREVVHRYEGALRTLDETCRVYQYVVKRTAAPFTATACPHPVVQQAVQRRTDYLNARRDDLYEVDLYFVLVYEGLRARPSSGRSASRAPSRIVRDWLSPSATITLQEDEVDRALAQLHHRAAALEVQLSDAPRLTRLTKAEAYGFLRRLVNYVPHVAAGAPLRYDTHLDYFLADSPIECHRTHLQVGPHLVQVLSLKEPPSATFPLVLEDLYTLPGEYIACLEWCRIPSDRMRRELQSRRRHFFNKRIALVNYVSPETRPDEMLVDESATATVRQLGDAMTEMEVNGHFFGECSLTLVLYGQDARLLDRSVAEATKIMAAHDGTFVAETYNLLNAWLSVIPGNSAHNLRRLALLETHCADLSFLFTLDVGQPQSAQLQAEALAVFETRHHTPYHYNLHVEDVGHSVVLGATGSGKSFLLNFLVLQAQKYTPLTVIFDLGHSYRKLAALLGGSYLELGARQSGVQINPFAMAPTREHLHFLHAFVRVLLEGADEYRLSDAEDRELYEAIENVYVLDRSQRRLFTLANLLPRAMAARLSRWVDGGRYADLFDHVEDTFEVQTCQVFDFEAMRAYPALLEPLLFYVLQRVSERVNDPAQAARLKICVLDEAWRFIQHPTLRGYVEESLKTWRKKQAAMLLATQSIDDFASAELLRTVVESCPSKLLLANPALDRRQYSELFQLNATELDLLVGLVPRRQFLLKRPGIAKVLHLAVDPHSYWLYTNTPLDNERVRAALEEYGLEAGLDRLASA